MNDKNKTKAQLITELRELRRRVAQMEEAAKSQHGHAPLRALAETAASAIFIFQDSVFRYTNPATSKLTGYTAEELLGANIWDCVHPEHRELVEERALAWLRGEPVPSRSEFKILTRSGQTRWINADSTLTEFDGKPAALTIAYESTLSKLAEEALIESEQRVSEIIETAQEAIWIVDAKANTTYVNQRLAEMLGYTTDEVLGRSVFNFVGDADRLEAGKYLERGRNGIKQQHDFRFRRKDGSELWTMVSTTPLFDSAGVFVGGLAMLIDITERRRSEEALKESEARLQAAIENLPFELWARDTDGRCIIQNPYSVLQWGNFLGTLPEEIAPDREAMALWDAINTRAYAGDVVKGESEITEGKQTGWYYYVVGPIRVDGEIHGILGVNIDITDRKRAEEALRQSEARFRVLAQTIPSVIFIFQNSKIVYANSYAEAHSGYSEQELRSMDFWEMVHPDHRQTAKERGLARLRGEAVPSRYEVKLITKSGEERWVDFAASFLEFEGKPSVLVAAFDITDRKRVEDALHATENRFRTLAETASDAIVTIDESGHVAFVNQAAERVFGYSQREMLGADLTVLMPEYLRHLHRVGFARYKETGKRHISWETIEFPGLHKNGNEIPLELSFGEFTEGDKHFFTSIVRDITDRKRAEEALHETQQRLQHVLSFSPAIIYLLRVEDESFTLEWVSESHTRLTGHEPIEGLSEGSWVDHIHPDDRERVLAEMPRLFTGNRLVHEYRIRHKDGGYLWLHDESTLLRDESGQAIEVIGWCVDVTERREAEAALRDSDERFRILVSSMDDIVFTLDREQRYSGVFGRWFEKFGFDRELIIGKTATNLFGIQAGRIHEEPNARSLAGEQVVYEWSMATNGERRHFQTSLSPIRDHNGEVTGLVGVGRDITDRKQAEEALRASEERYRDLVENARDIIYSHDLKGNYTSVNKAVERITGYTREEALKLNFAQFVAPEYIETARQMIAAKLAGQIETVYDLEIIAKDGRRLTVEVNTRLVLQDDVPIGIHGIARDVTERKRAEEALRQSEERFRRYFELGLIGMAIASPSKGFIEVNDKICEILGYERAELLQLTWAQLTHPDDLAANLANFNRLLAGEVDGYSMDKRYIRKDGALIHATISVSCVRRADRSVDYSIALLEDVTERKQAEQAVRESQAHLQAILDNCPAMIFEKDLDGRYLQVNRQFERTFNLPPEQVLGRTDDELFLPELAAAFRATDGAVLEASRALEFEEAAAYADGLHTYIVHKFPLQDAAGNLYAVGGVSTDITARKRAEDDLRKQKEIFQKIFDHVPVMIRFLDADGRVRLVNREWERTLGWSLKEIESRGLDVFAELYPDPEYRQYVLNFIAASTGKFTDLKTTARDGRVIDTTFANVRLEDGTNVGIGRDITERKRAEKALRASERKFRVLAETAWSAIFISTESSFLYVNPFVEAFTGYSSEELLSMSFWELLDPSIREMARERVLARLRGEQVPSRNELKIITKSGEERWVDYAASLMEFEGQPAVLGTAFDITERKRAERALRRSEAKFRTLAETAASVIFIHRGSRLLYVNPAAEAVSGYTTDELLALRIRDVVAPEFREFMRERARARQRGEPVLPRSEFKIVARNGEERWLDAADSVFEFEGESAVLGTAFDVTERKRAEEALRETNQTLQALIQASPLAIVALDLEHKVKRWNPAAERIFGWSEQEALGRTVPTVPEDQWDDFLSKFSGILEKASFTLFEVQGRRKDGELVDVGISAAPTRDASGAVTGTMAVIADLTEQKRAQEALLQRTAELAALHEIGLEISGESELSRVLDVVTRRAAELLNAHGCSIYIRDRDQCELNLVASLDSELIGLRLKEGEGLTGRVAVSGLAQAIGDYSEWSGRAPIFDGRGLGPVLGAPLKWQQTVIGAITLARRQGEERFTSDDIQFLEQIAAEAAIAIHQATLFDEVQESQRRLQVLSHRLLDAQEAERKRLSRELHDQIGQALTAVQISLQILQSSCDDTSASPLNDCLTIIDDALQQVHDLSLDLRPSLLDDLGLVAALRWYVDRVASRAGLVRRFEADVLETRLAPQVETACFRIAQEALTNVLRHAHAASVWVQLTQRDSGLQLVVQDDGVGFDVRAAMSQTGVNASLGLQGMQERAAALGGIVEVKSQPGNGVEVLASIPLAQPPSP